MHRPKALHLALTLAPLTAALAAQAASSGRPDVPTDRAAPTRLEARAALRKAVAFFRGNVAVRGGYLWRYSADLSKREGEGKVGESTAWVQPPGTPSVGEALVDAYELSGERLCLDGARESAMALVKSQLHSGGWPYRIEFDPAERRRFAYRTDGRPSRKARDVSVLDDDTTQSALRFLMKYDRATRFRDAIVHEAALYGLESLLGAQFPNGAWPQVYRGPVDRDKHPVRRAGYREDGEYTRAKAYWEFYTLNDSLMRDVIETVFLAAHVYREERYRRVAMKGGDFLILAQMPEPQPGWAQQYDFDMHPCWARKFEPASVTGGESQGVMATLLDLYERTGERRYLEPIPRALAYFRRSLLPSGKLARFYELGTNRPLYFTRDYKLTYSDKDVPTHYSFTVDSRLDRIERRYRGLASKKWRPPAEDELPPRPSPKEVRRMIEAMDERGAWVEDGRLRFWGKSDPTRRVIDPRTFARNVRALARYSRADEIVSSLEARDTLGAEPVPVEVEGRIEHILRAHPLLGKTCYLRFLSFHTHPGGETDQRWITADVRQHADSPKGWVVDLYGESGAWAVRDVTPALEGVLLDDEVSWEQAEIILQAVRNPTHHRSANRAWQGFTWWDWEVDRLDGGERYLLHIDWLSDGDSYLLLPDNLPSSCRYCVLAIEKAGHANWAVALLEEGRGGLLLGRIYRALGVGY